MTYPHQGGQPSRPGDFATDWGIKEHPSRPKKVNQLTQLLWAYFGLSGLMVLFAVVGAALALTVVATAALLPLLGKANLVEYVNLLTHYDLDTAAPAFAHSSSTSAVSVGAVPNGVANGLRVRPKRSGSP